MDTANSKLPQKSFSAAAKRMRLYRQQRRRGIRSVIVRLHVTEIDALIVKHYLAVEDRQNRKTVQQAVNAFVSDALGDFQ